jgi:hypothetical protein
VTLFTPQIDDGRGYRVQVEELAFLRLGFEDMRAFCARRLPLGFTEPMFNQFVASLQVALKADALPGCDVRLQGSSANFFSSEFKPMPWHRADVFDVFRTERHRLPLPEELDSIESLLEEGWPGAQARPMRRPFDSLRRVGIARYPSDYDIQLSSDDLVLRAGDAVRALGIPVDKSRVDHPDYDFIRKDIFEQICPALWIWSLLQSDVLGRSVTIAAFGSAGPPNTGKPVSSHFKDSDWIIDVPEA